MRSFRLRNKFLRGNSFLLGGLFLCIAGAVLLLAGHADATVGAQYAPKVFVFGDVSYTGQETLNYVNGSAIDSEVNGTLTINSDGYYKLIGSGTPSDKVVVNGGVDADILIEDLELDVSAFDSCPFQISPGATVTLRLAGENFLKSGGDWAALAVPEGAALTITSAAGDGSLSGSLKAISVYGAGIGGSRGEAGGSITINGGSIHAIGSYSDTPGGTDIVGGGAAIGGGWQGDGGTIVINGGAVSADIDGTAWNWSAACIGGGGEDEADETYDGGEAGNITITGGFVKTIASSLGAGIGSGVTPKNGNANGKITISGGVVTTANVMYAGAGIGGGWHGGGGTIVIDGGVVKASNIIYSTGIGGGWQGDSGTIAIHGGFVTASTVGGTGDSPAIGGGAGGHVGSISISGGVVVAQGGTGTSIGPGAGAGVDGNIALSGGTVIGTGGFPIGASNAGEGGVIAVTPVNISAGGMMLLSQMGVNGYASSQDWAAKGILIGDLNIAYDDGAKTIFMNTDLTVPQGATLAVPPGYTLDMNGSTIHNNGQILNAGTIAGGTPSGKVVSCDSDFRPVSGSAELFNGFYIAPGETLTVSAGQTVTVPAGFTATNDGVIAVSAGGTLNVTGTLKNRGLVLSEGGTVLGDTNSSDGFGTGGTLTLDVDTWTAAGVVPLSDFTVSKDQTLVVPAGATVALRGSAVNEGKITIEQGGTLLVYGSLTNKGTVDNSGTLDNKGTLDNFGTVAGYGTFINEQGAVISNEFTGLQAYGDGEGAGSPGEIPFALFHVAKGGTLDNYGIINNSGTILVDGTFINEPDGLVNNADGALIRVTESGTFWNKGTVNNEGTLKNEGTIKNDGVINISGGGVLDNTGVIDSANGTINGTVSGNGTLIDSNASGDAAAKSSTDLTKGPVTLVDAAGQVLTDKAQLVQQPDGSWIITAPAGTDMSGVALVFSLPDDGTSVSPENGALQDFSGGKTVTYTVVSANGQNTAKYQVRLKTLASDGGTSSTLLSTDASKWKLVESDDADGSAVFLLEAPMVDDVKAASLDVVEAALGADYEGVKFLPTANVSGVPVPLGTPVLSVTGKAPSPSDLQRLSVSRVEWTLTDGGKYFQDIDPPVTYADIHADISVLASSDVPSASSGDGGSGCTTGIWPIMVVLFATGLLFSRK
jgi:hypothetical protein